MAAARRYAVAHQALDVIETAAILGQAQGPQAPVRGAAAPVLPGTTAADATTQTQTIS